MLQMAQSAASLMRINWLPVNMFDQKVTTQRQNHTSHFILFHNQFRLKTCYCITVFRKWTVIWYSDYCKERNV